MRAIKIDVIKREVYEVELEDSLEAIYHHLECSCFCQVGTAFGEGDVLWVDDNGLLHEPLGAFVIGWYPQALSGHGLVVGLGAEGTTVDANTALGMIKAMVTFVDTDLLPQPFIRATGW